METTYEGGQSETRSTNGSRSKSGYSGSKQQSSSSAEFNSFVTDIEDVIKKVAHVSDADVARVREKIQSALSTTRSSIADSAAQLKVQAQQAAKYADDYVHDSPWQAVGIGAALAAVLGLSIGYLASRR